MSAVTLLILSLATAMPARTGDPRPATAKPVVRPAPPRAASPAPVSAGSSAMGVVGSKHDLSASGPGIIRAVTEPNPCVFCHLPHGRSSRPDIGAGHAPYRSSTVAARPGAPSGASRICLSCHDGTIAVGETRTRRIATGLELIPADRPSNLGTDLRGTHPVSFWPAPTSHTHRPPLKDAVKLDRSGQVQCTSCHDPHAEFGGAPEGKFLVKSTTGAELCLSCHEGRVFASAGASHATSSAPLPAGAAGRAGESLADAGCGACHRPHGAAPEARLLPAPGGDDAACLRCHDTLGGGAAVGGDLRKPHGHGDLSPELHDAAEGRPGASRALPERSPGTARHVACVDCHDPHLASAERPVSAGLAGGALAGMWGIDQNGRRVEPVQFEYEVCFKCHGDSANQPQGLGARTPQTVRRAVPDVNLRRVFDPSSPSYHPVVAPGRSLDVPGLKAPYTTGSVIGCSDCHASDTGRNAGGTGPRGPHGSIHSSLLERAYSTADLVPETPAAYALCYKCHERDVLLSDDSGFPIHARHLRGPLATSCSTCHAAHGVSQRAAAGGGGAHLVDFDVAVVGTDASGLRQYRSTGARTGSCSLSCHGQEHAETTYGPGASLTPTLLKRIRPARPRK